VILDRRLCSDLAAFAVLYRACAYDAVARELESHFIVRHVPELSRSKLLDAQANAHCSGQAPLMATGGLASTGGSTARGPHQSAVEDNRSRH